MEKLSHINEKGKAEMVDVGHKPDQLREAFAKGSISLSATTRKLIAKNLIRKGDVLTLAEVAGIQAAKQTPHLVPLCHTLMLNKVKLEAVLTDTGVEVSCRVSSQGKTGVEMEALTGVSVALLTVYDMCKAVDKEMVIGDIHLVEKTKKDIQP